MSFNSFGGGKAAEPVTQSNEATEAQFKQVIADLNKKIKLANDDISILATKKADILQSIEEIKKEKKLAEKAFSDELLNREMAVNTRETAVLSNESVLADRINEFEVNKNKQLLSISKREDQLLLRDKDLSQLRSRLDLREQELVSRETKIVELEDKAIRAGKKLDEREAEIVALEESIKAQLSDLKIKSDSLIEREAIIRQREQDCKSKENELLAERQELDTKIAKLDAGREELNKRALEVENQSKIAASEAEAAKLIKKQADGQALENQQRSDTLDDREAALKILQKQLTGDK